MLSFVHALPRTARSKRALRHARVQCRADSSGSHALSHALRVAPSHPGVYRFLDHNKQVLYVGKARRIRARLRQYLVSSAHTASGVSVAQRVSPRIRSMLQAACSVDFIITTSEAAALALEASIVHETQPLYNVLLKDDRRHPYVLITLSDTYPRIVLTRSRKRANKHDRLYGPFVNETVLRKLLTVVHATFPLRQRPKKLFSDRPCINYDLGRCPGVCQQLITPEEYRNTIDKVTMLFSGRVTEVIKQLRAEMCHHSSLLQYEQAAIIRDRIAHLESAFGNAMGLQHAFEHVQQASAMVSPHCTASRDIFAISTSDTVCKVVLFQIRAGKVISRLVFSVEPTAEDAEMLNAVLTAHYARVTHRMEIPEELVLCTPITDKRMLEIALSEKRGKKVLVKGKKGVSLARIVQTNADMEVKIEKDLTHDAARDLLALESMLRPHFESLNTSRKDIGSVGQATSQDRCVLERIECFDVSHTSGSNAVGSMAVFIDGSPCLSEYRRYNLGAQSSCKGHPDDYASVHETLAKRFRQFGNGTSNAAEVASLPQLIIIDGGKGQLSAAADALRLLGLHGMVPLISIAKGEEAVFVDGQRQAINYDVPSGTHVMSNGVRLVCRLRDEAHRTAVMAHRKKRGKQALKSGLDSVPGLGAQKRAALLEHFHGSAEAIANAQPHQLWQTPGIGRALAQRLYNHFHGDPT
eukprot:TRINITY_DN1400_c0_g2_i2.p1 TRINITY_DN1400_c0_g2~~TRINITY_DN1400_c0_g2_i2.p1  ORF type:complete len:696 (+),score=115.52 TRINITY_DN1400_c0_g2_i2:1629-3716(+)